MLGLTLEEASKIVDEALKKGREMSLPPLCVAVLDAGGHLKCLKREDGAGILRPEIATGKAWGTLGMGESTRELGMRLKDLPAFVNALGQMSGGRVVPVPGGVLILRGSEVVGAAGASGASSGDDEVCILAGIEATGLEAKV